MTAKATISADHTSLVLNVGAYVSAVLSGFTTVPPPKTGAALDTEPGGDPHAALVESWVNVVMADVPPTKPTKNSPAVAGVPNAVIDGVELVPPPELVTEASATALTSPLT